MSRKLAWFAAGVGLAIAAVALAGGFPSRPKFSTVTVQDAAATHSQIAVRTPDGTAAGGLCIGEVNVCETSIPAGALDLWGGPIQLTAGSVTETGDFLSIGGTSNTGWTNFENVELAGGALGSYLGESGDLRLDANMHYAGTEWVCNAPGQMQELDLSPTATTPLYWTYDCTTAGETYSPTSSEKVCLSSGAGCPPQYALAGEGTSSGCQVDAQVGFGTTCTRETAGEYSIPFTNPGGLICIANAYAGDTAWAIPGADFGTNQILVNVMNSAGTGVDQGFNVICEQT